MLKNLIPEALEHFPTVVAKSRLQEGRSVEVVLDPSLYSDAHRVVVIV